MLGQASDDGIANKISDQTYKELMRCCCYFAGGGTITAKQTPWS